MDNDRSEYGLDRPVDANTILRFTIREDILPEGTGTAAPIWTTDSDDATKITTLQSRNSNKNFQILDANDCNCLLIDESVWARYNTDLGAWVPIGSQGLSRVGKAKENVKKGDLGQFSIMKIVEGENESLEEDEVPEAYEVAEVTARTNIRIKEDDDVYLFYQIGDRIPDEDDIENPVFDRGRWYAIPVNPKSELVKFKTEGVLDKCGSATAKAIESTQGAGTGEKDECNPIRDIMVHDLIGLAIFESDPSGAEEFAPAGSMGYARPLEDSELDENGEATDYEIISLGVGECCDETQNSSGSSESESLVSVSFSDSLSESLASVSFSESASDQSEPSASNNQSYDCGIPGVDLSNLPTISPENAQGVLVVGNDGCLALVPIKKCETGAEE